MSFAFIFIIHTLKLAFSNINKFDDESNRGYSPTGYTGNPGAIGTYGTGIPPTYGGIGYGVPGYTGAVGYGYGIPPVYGAGYAPVNYGKCFFSI